MRKVTFSVYVSGEGTITKSGIFHRWGMKAMEGNDGNIHWSVAICEDETGQIFLVIPDKMKFEDRPDQVDPNWKESEMDFCNSGSYAHNFGSSNNS